MRLARAWFEQRLRPLPHSAETKAYVVGVYSEFVASTTGDMSAESITLAYANAQEFAAFQRIGDWSLWVQTFLPEAIQGHQVVIDSFGRRSYEVCYRMLKCQLGVYQELAQDLSRLSAMARSQILPRV